MSAAPGPAGARGRRRRRGPASLGVLCGLLLSAVGSTASAGSPDDERALEQQLAERFVPVMMLKEQPEECSTDGEPYGPTSVEILLGNPEIALRQVGRSDPVVMRAPTASDLFGLGEGFFLDFPGSSLTPACIYERDFDKYRADVEPTVYAHVVVDPDAENDDGVAGAVFLQFWFYWYYNDWNNKHESDWEGITLKFETDSVAGALATEPVAVGFSQHEGGERAAWGDAKLERDGDRPVVYSSAGSHASYFESALYLGRSGSEGFGCDDTTGPSTRVDPSVVVLPDGIDDPDDPLAWIEYGGRWGERQGGAFNGPTGPAAKDRWLDPAPWFDELRDGSVVIPAGDSEVVGLIDLFCGTVEAGSATLVTFTVSPARVIVGLLIIAGLVGVVVRRTAWDRVAATPVIARRRAGQIVGVAGRVYAARPFAFLLFGAVYVPAAIVAGLIGLVLQRLPFFGQLLSLAGSGSGTNLVFALFAGSVANVAAYVVVNGLVTRFLHEGGNGIVDAVDAVRAVWDRRADVVGAIVRAFAIVFVLLVSVVGIPWAIRQLVRYQFVGQSLMLGAEDGADALRASSRRVRGRWWHTFVVTGLLNGMVAAAVLVVGLLLLVIASGLPLWSVSALLSLVSVAVVPFAAIVMTYLHADALAAEQTPVPADR